jgi:predicted nucleic acid-binding Zn ribbon protein
MVEHNQSLSCLFCEKALTGKQEKFCSRHCKDRWWNRKRQERIKGFESLKSALKKAGYEIRRLPSSEDPERTK